MSQISLEAVLSDPVGCAKILIEIAWRLPLRVSLHFWESLFNFKRHPKTSLKLALATSVFAPTLGHNWPLLLARPRSVEPNTGLLFPENVLDGERDKDKEHGFHGFLYTGHASPKFGKNTLDGADAIWIHAHGGGFYAGEARQYHHTFMRWVDKASEEFDIDLRILAVEYRK